MILLVLSLLLQESETAEKFLTRVEQKYRDAKTVTWKVKTTMEMKGQAGEVALESSAKGEKFKLEVSAKFDQFAMKADLRSDGATRRLVMDEQTTEGKTAAGFAAGIRALIVRGGSLMPLVILKEKGLECDLEAITASEVSFGADEKVAERAARVLTYTLTKKGEKESLTVKLWVDAETLVLRKREITSANGDLMREDYTDCTLDKDLADDLFALPASK